MKWIGENIRDYVSRFRNNVEITGNLNLAASSNLSFGGVDIIDDSSGTTTLKNIDALDATTEATIEAAVDTLASLTTAAGLTSIGAAGATTDIAAGDLTMYNAVNDGNPTISLGSSATNRLEIKATYNSGNQELCDIDFTTYTSSVGTNDGRFGFFVDEVQILNMKDDGMTVYGNVNLNDGSAFFSATDTTTSSATQGGRLLLQSDDSAAMADNHRLGVIEFKGAEDGSNTRSIGARIQAIARDAWDGSNNDADLEFYTTDGTTESKVLTLDADKLATFTGGVTVTGALTGTLATASQTNITGVGTITTGVWNGTDITRVGIIGAGVWNGTAIASAYLDADTAHLSGSQTFTGTKTLNSFKGTAGATVTNILDEDAMGSDSATALATQQSIKAYVDAKYASSIISFAGQATMLSSGNWVGAGKPGIGSHTWNKDYSVNTEINGTTEATVPKQWAQGGVRVPFACIIDGISCIISNASNNTQATVGLFFARAADGTTAVDWGDNSSTEPILQIHADANNESGSYTGRPARAEVTESDIAMAAGDVFYPAIKLTGVTSGGATDVIYASFSVHVKTLIA